MLGFVRKAPMNGGDCNEKDLQERTSGKKRETSAYPSYEPVSNWNDDANFGEGREWQHRYRTDRKSVV